VVIGTIYFFLAATAIRWLGIRLLPGLLGAATLVCAAFGAKAALDDSFGQGG
jgi:hypothetical protein